MSVEFALEFHGRDADKNRLDLYDASISYNGMARVISILGHYYVTGDVISHAPKSVVQIYLYPPEAGSFRTTVAAAVIGGVITVPFAVLVQRTFDDWFPRPDPQMQQVIELLQEQNKLLRQEGGVAIEKTEEEKNQEVRADRFIEEKAPDFLTLRGITANSFKDIFRPVGRSADYVAMTSGPFRTPISSIDESAAIRIQSERLDQKIETIVGVVNNLSRSSKTGIIFSEERGRSIPFQDNIPGRLPPEDDYSWSQHFRRKIEITGRFVYWFDGRVKRFLVENMRRLED
ncbi:hypothetical protein [Nisaea sp.]|uniref:DUF7946 domain-containing protein n=1 Tax=Nisaea sp. TaxID=2024842 RepID=UPI003266A54A